MAKGLGTWQWTCRYSGARYGLTFKGRTSIIFAVAIGLTVVLVHVCAAQTLLTNGDLSAGSDNSATGWHTQSWINLPSTAFNWIRPSNGYPGELEIENLEGNDARWVQAVHLSPGVYYISAEVMTDGVGTSEILDGARVSLMDPGVSSEELKGNSGWRTVGFYVAVGKGGANVQVMLRLGGYGGFNIGRAFFRGASVVRVDPLPPGVRPYDLDMIRHHWGGEPWTVIPPFIILGFAACASCRMFVRFNRNRIS